VNHKATAFLWIILGGFGSLLIAAGCFLFVTQVIIPAREAQSGYSYEFLVNDDEDLSLSDKQNLQNLAREIQLLNTKEKTVNQKILAGIYWVASAIFVSFGVMMIGAAGQTKIISMGGTLFLRFPFCLFAHIETIKISDIREITVIRNIKFGTTNKNRDSITWRDVLIINGNLRVPGLIFSHLSSLVAFIKQNNAEVVLVGSKEKAGFSD
jgi:hypothetical protein